MAAVTLPAPGRLGFALILSVLLPLLRGADGGSTSFFRVGGSAFYCLPQPSSVREFPMRR